MPSSNILSFRGFSLNCSSGALAGPSGPVPLRPKAVSLLELLARNAGRVISKEELLDIVWPEVTVSEETLTQTIHELRKALGEAGPVLIRTVPRRGYLFDTKPAAPSPKGISLSVLPFVNQSSYPEQHFFAQGLTADLNGALSLIEEFAVLPEKDGRSGARYHLSGAVRASAGKIRVHARLDDTQEDRALWHGRFDGQQSEIFAFQDEITRSVAVALQVHLTTGDFARLWDGKTRSLVAWELTVRARSHVLRWTEADMDIARELAEQAVAADPDYSAARLFLGMTYWYDARFFATMDRDFAVDSTEAAAQEILRRDAKGPSGYILMSYAMWMRDRYDEAVAHARKASILAPGDAWARGHLGVILVFSGEPARGLEAIDAAIGLAPRRFDWMYFHRAHALLWTKDYAGAMTEAGAYRDVTPEDPWGLYLVGLIHAFAGRPDAARRAIGEMIAGRPPLRIEEVRRSQRYRNVAWQDRIVEAMRAAGMPE
jgi:adenylate cyclase